MRNNGPVTGREIELKDDIIIVSKTDLQGRITFGNKEFVDISGYSKEELMGQPHNVLRHSDMPKEAFEDLWRDLKANRHWSGYVKNRAKNGDHYWVLATATPIVEGGVTKGYISIRTKPDRAMVSAVEDIYRQFREGRAHGLAVSHGRVVKTSVFANMRRRFENISARITSAAAVLCLMIAVTGVSGMYFQGQIQESLRTVYEDRTVPAAQLARILDLTDENVIYIEQAADGNARDTAVKIGKNNEEIAKAWASYMATYLTPDEKKLADEFADKNKDFMARGVTPALDMIKAGRTADLTQLAATVLPPLFESVKQVNRALIKRQMDVAADEYNKGREHESRSITASIVIVVASVLISALFIALIRRYVAGRLSYLASRLESVATGNLNTDITDGDDEVGRILTVVKGMQSRLAYAEHEKREIDREFKQRQRDEMNRVAEEFEKNVKSIVDTVLVASGGLQSTAGVMTKTAEQTSLQAGHVAAASEQATVNVQTVSAATEELTASIREIQQRMSASSEMIAQVVRQADLTNVKVKEQTAAAAKIGDVVSLINDIAAQTNLLALNATIEAARAGEAGKGFAVVASEVKALATQTAKATEDIAQQISQIQKVTEESAGAMQKITAAIGDVSQISSAIAAAVEEQGAATLEISRNVSEAAQGTRDVSTNIISVNSGAQQTGHAAGQVLKAADELSKNGQSLKNQVDMFLQGVRASAG